MWWTTSVHSFTFSQPCDGQLFIILFHFLAVMWWTTFVHFFTFLQPFYFLAAMLWKTFVNTFTFWQPFDGQLLYTLTFFSHVLDNFFILFHFLAAMWWTTWTVLRCMQTIGLAIIGSKLTLSYMDSSPGVGNSKYQFSFRGSQFFVWKLHFLTWDHVES